MTGGDITGDVGGDEKDELRRNPNSKNDDVGRCWDGLAAAAPLTPTGERNAASSGADTRRLVAKPAAVTTRSGPASTTDPGDISRSAGSTAVGLAAAAAAAAGLGSAAVDRASVVAACPYCIC